MRTTRGNGNRRTISYSFEKGIIMRLLSRGSICVAACIMFALPACAETPIRFKLDYSVAGYHTPFYLAKEKGWYSDAGLDVRIDTGKGSADTIKIVAANGDDLGFADFAAMGKAVSEGLPVIAVAAIVRDSLGCIVSFGNKPVRMPKDLEGKTLGEIPTGIAAYVLPAVFKKYGVDESKVNIVSYNYGANVPALLAGNIDATTGFYLTEYTTVKLNSNGREVVAMLLRDIGVDTYSNGIIANKEFLAKNKAAVEAFIKVSLKAVQYSIDHVDEAAAAGANNTETSKEIIKLQFERSIPFIDTPEYRELGPGIMKKAKWDATQDLMVSTGQQAKPVPDDELWTNSLVKQ